MTMTSEESTTDPCPTIPETFVDPLRIIKLARELKKGCAPGEDAVADPSEPAEGATTGSTATGETAPVAAGRGLGGMAPTLEHSGARVRASSRLSVNSGTAVPAARMLIDADRVP